MSSIEWIAPPTAAKKGRHNWSEIANELRAHPGEWARVLVGKSAATQAHHITHGVIVAFRPAGSFQGRSVTTDAGFDIYARYVGGESA